MINIYTDENHWVLLWLRKIEVIPSSGASSNKLFYSANSPLNLPRLISLFPILFLEMTMFQI